MKDSFIVKNSLLQFVTLMFDIMQPVDYSINF